MPGTVYTIGHSTRPIGEFVQLLRGHGITQLVDVRTIAKSRHNPQYVADALALSLPQEGIAYLRLEELGGLRHTGKNTVNAGWKNASFRAYADYMQTPQFAAGIDRLLAIAGEAPTAVMCAEAVPWRCHRSLIGDALLVRDVEVLDIISERSTRLHTMTRFAHTDGLQITYPEPDAPDSPGTRPPGR